MKPELLHYDRQQLENFLQDQLTSEQRLAIEEHVGQCETCRQQLHDTAADESWWEAAGDFLISDENDSQLDDTIRQLQPDVATSDSSVSPGDAIGEDTRPVIGIRQITSWLLPTDDPAMLGRMGGYEIAGIIGAGGMGVVLKGFDRSLNRYVAIKVLAPHLATSGAARKRFAREAQAAAAVVHNNVIAIHGVDETGDLPFLVMPYVRGTSLQKRIDRSGALSVSETLRIGMQTARGLAAAHDQGLVHRDIKPANILLDGTTERVLLTDFGLARAADDASLTHSGVIAGTPYFMSPEQAEGSAIDHRSDLFSLGSVLYAMCTGRPPFRADTSWGILRRVTDSEPHPIRDLNSDVPVWLSEIVQQLHSKVPSDRYQSAGEIADLLEDCLAHVQQPDQVNLPESIHQTLPSRTVSNNGLKALATAAMVSLAAVVAIVAMWPDSSPTGDTVQQYQGTPAGVSDTEQAAAAQEGNQSGDALSVADAHGTDLEPIADESLLMWDDASTELSEIRDAVDLLDDESLNLLFETDSLKPTSP